MVEIANFKTQSTGAEVATILDNENEILEVAKRSDGTYELTVHNRRSETDRWDDLSVVLKPQHFAVLGSIATMGAACTCGAPDDGKWANKHTASCANLNHPA